MEEMSRCSATGLRYAGLRGLAPMLRPSSHCVLWPGMRLQNHGSRLRSLLLWSLRSQHWLQFGDVKGPKGKNGIIGGSRSHWSIIEAWRDRALGRTIGAWGGLSAGEVAWGLLWGSYLQSPSCFVLSCSSGWCCPTCPRWQRNRPWLCTPDTHWASSQAALGPWGWSSPMGWWVLGQLSMALAQGEWGEPGAPDICLPIVSKSAVLHPALNSIPLFQVIPNYSSRTENEKLFAIVVTMWVYFRLYHIISVNIIYFHFSYVYYKTM